jgi:hypothetical protein
MQSTDGEEEFLTLDYFAGGVPALAVFTGAVEDLIRILDLNGDSSIKPRFNELCFVGAVSYFEAFCKDHFASILNIVPQLISKLSQAGIETRIDPMQILEARSGLRTQIGFLVTERMDLGTPDASSLVVNDNKGRLHLRGVIDTSRRRHHRSSQGNPRMVLGAEMRASKRVRFLTLAV